MRFCFKYLKLMKTVSAIFILLYNFSIFEFSGINLMNIYSYAVIKKLLDASIAYFILTFVTFGCACFIFDCVYPPDSAWYPAVSDCTAVF